MAKILDWDSHIGRRLRLRDLHVYFAVVQCGSMAKAAAHFRVSQPAVSKVIAELEHALGAPLVDRNSRGVEPTIYGRALLTRARAAFDELRQGVRDIEFLGDPTSGEVRVGCVEAFSATIMPSLIQRFSRSYPHVTVHIDNVPPYPGGRLSGLRDRKHDLLFARWVTPQPQGHLEDDLNVEFLFDDPTVAAVGMQSPWARRRKIGLAELTEQTWILPPPGSPGHTDIADAFGSHGLAMPKVAVMTTSVPLRAQLIADGQYITTFNRSALLLDALPYALKILPVELPLPRRPVVFVTLKNRTLSPVVERFIEHVRDFAKTLARP